MMFPKKWILTKYKLLITHMFIEKVVNTMAKANLDLSRDVKTFIGLVCILPLIECI
jgi:hypothetical protein